MSVCLCVCVYSVQGGDWCTPTGQQPAHRMNGVRPKRRRLLNKCAKKKELSQTLKCVNDGGGAPDADPALHRHLYDLKNLSPFRKFSVCFGKLHF